MRAESKLGILIPVFNGERYLPSLLSQLEHACNHLLQHTCISHVEVIWIDDGSTDTTLQLLYRYNPTHVLNRIVHFEVNQGVACALNAGIELAQEMQFVARVDVDDELPLERFVKQIEFLHRNAAVDVVGCSVEIPQGNFSRIVQFPCDSDQVMLDMMFYCSLAHPTLMFKGSCLKRVRYDESKLCEDYALWLKAVVVEQSLIAANLSAEECLVPLRRRASSVSRRLVNIEESRELILNTWKSFGIDMDLETLEFLCRKADSSSSAPSLFVLNRAFESLIQLERVFHDKVKNCSLLKEFIDTRLAEIVIFDLKSNPSVSHSLLPRFLSRYPSKQLLHRLY